LRTGWSPKFDEPANGTKIVQSRKRPPEANRTETREQKISPIVPLMVFLIIASWFITFCTAFIYVPSAMAGPMSQQAESDARVQVGADSEGLLDIVEADINAGKFAESEPRLNGYIKDHPDSSRAHYDLGYVQFRTHQIGASIKELSKSLELNPKSAEAHKVLALNCSIIGRYDLAEVELQEAARLKPDSAEIHYFLARTYYTRGVYPLAKSEFEASIRLDPSNIKAYSNLGITMEALGDTDGALKNYAAAIQLEDRQEHKSEWPYIYLSAFYNRQKNADEALNYARKAVDINSASDTAYFEMAKAYRTQKQLQKSVDAARSAVAINSRVPDYYYVMGLVLRELGDQQASQEALQKYAQLQQHSNDAVPEHPTEEPLIAPEPQ
jgi:tetratricopeptide (TPR) repeat protein